MARGQLRIPSKGDRSNDPDTQINEALKAVGLVATAPLDLEEEFVLWPECETVFKLWLGVQTQWSISPTGYRTGLNYAGVNAYLEAWQVPVGDWAELYGGLQLMERAFLNELAS